MNALMNVTTAQTMSSREIAELVGSRHDKVKQSIERLAHGGTISLPPMGIVSIQRERRVESVEIYNLDKRASLIVVAQLCPEFTAKIVDRWQELETQAAKPALNPANFSRMQLIELAMQAEQERMELEHKVEEMQPAVQGFDRIARSDGSFCITDAAKTLQIMPKALFAYLDQNRWTYQRIGGTSRLAYQDKITSGLLEHKINVVQRGDGTEKVTQQARVTAKGLARLAKEFQITLPPEPMAA